MEDTKIVYGLFNLREERELARTSFGYIAKDIREMKTNCIRFGFHLTECKNMKYYEDFGYEDFYEFVEKNFHMDKSAVSRYINIFLEFSEKTSENVNTMFLDEKYEDYSYSQLCEMLPLDEKQRAAIKPDMSISEIRKKKKEWKEKEHVATSQLTEGKNKCQNESVVIEDVEYKEVNQPELPILKNNDQRKEFIEDYQNWLIWIDIPQTGERYWKYALDNGVKLVVKATLRFAYLGYGKGYAKERSFGSEEYYIFDGDKTAYDAKANKSALIEYLKEYQRS